MPWVPRSVYDLMLRALEARAFSAFDGKQAEAESTLGAQWPPKPLVADWVPPRPTTPAAPLSVAVLNACDYFADGDPTEKAANLQLAYRLAADGATDQVILTRIRQGGIIDTALTTG